MLRRIIDVIRILPLITNIVFFLWALFLAPEQSCGSEDPGLCFGLGIIFGVVGLPLAVLCLGIFLLRIYLRHRKKRDSPV